jgi:hypothetical protein
MAPQYKRSAPKILILGGKEREGRERKGSWEGGYDQSMMYAYMEMSQ